MKNISYPQNDFYFMGHEKTILKHYLKKLFLTVFQLKHFVNKAFIFLFFFNENQFLFPQFYSLIYNNFVLKHVLTMLMLINNSSGYSQISWK